MINPPAPLDFTLQSYGEKMTEIPQAPEIVFTFTALDDAVVAEAEAAFGPDDVSLSKRMIGGALVDVFIKPIVELIGKVLDFRVKQGGRITNAKISIGKEQISLEGYGVDDVERLLNSEGFQQALSKLRT